VYQNAFAFPAGAYSAPPHPTAAGTFVVLFAEVVQVNVFVRKKIGLLTKSNRSIYTIFALSLHLSVQLNSRA